MNSLCTAVAAAALSDAAQLGPEALRLRTGGLEGAEHGARDMSLGERLGTLALLPLCLVRGGKTLAGGASLNAWLLRTAEPAAKATVKKTSMYTWQAVNCRRWSPEHMQKADPAETAEAAAQRQHTAFGSYAVLTPFRVSVPADPSERVRFFLLFFALFCN